eukprot:scaffold27929_cov107-Isochrysis_galbana.AAC.3
MQYGYGRHDERPGWQVMGGNGAKGARGLGVWAWRLRAFVLLFGFGGVLGLRGLADTAAATVAS